MDPRVRGARGRVAERGCLRCGAETTDTFTDGAEGHFVDFVGTSCAMGGRCHIGRAHV